VQVDGVLASDNIGDGGTASLGLLGLLGGGHFYVVVGREGDDACRDALRGRRGVGLCARFSHEAGEIPSEPWQLHLVTCAFRIQLTVNQPRDQVHSLLENIY